MKRLNLFFEPDTGGGSGGSGGAGGGTLLSGAQGGGGGGAADGGGDGSGAAGAGSGGSGGGAQWLKDDAGTFAEGWVNRLPEDLRTNPSLTVVPSLEALAKSYVETKALVGKKLEAPGEKATPEQVAAWRKTVGAPDKPEGYLGEAKTLRPDTIPEAMWDTASEQKFLQLAHKHHLTPRP